MGHILPVFSVAFVDYHATMFCDFYAPCCCMSHCLLFGARCQSVKKHIPLGWNGIARGAVLSIQLCCPWHSSLRLGRTLWLARGVFMACPHWSRPARSLALQELMTADSLQLSTLNAVLVKAPRHFLIPPRLQIGAQIASRA